jgi:membrane protein
MASHLALTALMTMFPFIIFVAAMAGFLGEAQLADQVADLLFAVWPEGVATPIAQEVHRVLTVRRGDLLTVSVLVTIIIAGNGVDAIRAALNRAYRAVERRSFLRLRMQSILFVIIGAASAVVLGLLGVLGPFLWGMLVRSFPGLAPYQGSFTAVRYVVIGVVLTLALVAAHLLLPAQRPRALRIWPGIVLTLVLWWLMTAGFTAYVRTFADYAYTYAGLAGIVVALFYLYLLGFILILGAEFNAALAGVLGELPYSGLRSPSESTATKGSVTKG